MRKISLKTGISLLIAVGIALPVVASAGEPGQAEDTSIKVSYEDLNINSEAGVRVLYSRLKRASEKACNVESLSEHGSIERVRAAKLCYHEVLSSAVENIDSDALTRIHAS
jgi:UrcA family protein